MFQDWWWRARTASPRVWAAVAAVVLLAAATLAAAALLSRPPAPPATPATATATEEPAPAKKDPKATAKVLRAYRDLPKVTGDRRTDDRTCLPAARKIQALTKDTTAGRVTARVEEDVAWNAYLVGAYCSPAKAADVNATLTRFYD